MCVCQCFNKIGHPRSFSKDLLLPLVIVIILSCLFSLTHFHLTLEYKISNLFGITPPLYKNPGILVQYTTSKP